MGNGVVSLVFVLAIFSSMVSFLPQTYSRSLINTRDNDLIKQTCLKTPSPSLCESTIHSDNRSTNANLVTLALITVNAVESKAKEIVGHVNELLKSSTTTKQHDSLESCKFIYNSIVIGDVIEAIEGVTSGKYKFGVLGMRDVANEAAICEDGLKKTGNSPLTDLNNSARDLANIAVSIVGLLS